MSIESNVVLQLEDGWVDVETGRGARAGQELQLNGLQHVLLRLLWEARGQVLTHEHLYQSLYGVPWGGAQEELQRVRSLIFRLRQKLERRPEQPIVLCTDQGDGYYLVCTGFGPRPEPTPRWSPGPVLEPYAASQHFPRPALEERIRGALEQGVPLVLRGGWRAGKSWMLSWIRHTLLAPGEQWVRLHHQDLSELERKDPQRLLHHTALRVAHALRADRELVDRVWQRCALPDLAFIEVMRRLLQTRGAPRVFLAVDNVDRLGDDSAMPSFFAALRGCFADEGIIRERARLVMTSNRRSGGYFPSAEHSVITYGRTVVLGPLSPLERGDFMRWAGVSWSEARQVELCAALGGHLFWLRALVVACAESQQEPEQALALARGAEEGLGRALGDLHERMAQHPALREELRALLSGEPVSLNERSVSLLMRLGLIGSSNPPYEPLATRLCEWVTQA